jgi:ABC-2 type transport system ATP-binding protein
MGEAEELCDRVAIVDHGRLIACGTPTELTRTAVADETWFSATPALPVEELASALGVAAEKVQETRPGEYTIGATATPVLIADLAAWLRDRDVQLDELRGSRRSLEEVFLRLTREGRG